MREQRQPAEGTASGLGECDQQVVVAGEVGALVCQDRLDLGSVKQFERARGDDDQAAFAGDAVSGGSRTADYDRPEIAVATGHRKLAAQLGSVDGG